MDLFFAVAKYVISMFKMLMAEKEQIITKLQQTYGINQHNPPLFLT